MGDEYDGEDAHEVNADQSNLHTDPAVAKDLMFDRFDTFPDRGVSAWPVLPRNQAAFVNTSGERWMATGKWARRQSTEALDRFAGKVAERMALVDRWRSRSLTKYDFDALLRL